VTLTRREALRHLAAGALGAVGGLGAHSYLYHRHEIGLTKVDLPVSGLSRAHDGVRIGFITDLHHGVFVSQQDIARAVSLVVAERPDLVVLGGDYVTNFDQAFAEPCAEALAALSAPYGVHAVLGNHDDERAVPAALRRRGFAVLRDVRTTVTIAGEPLGLAGLRFWTRQAGEIARIVRGGPATTLLLAHDPRRLAQAAALAIPAILSGHTHGGQVVVPGLGAIAARRFPVVSGLGGSNGTAIFVSRGVGTVYLPVRFNCPPEVAVITLRTKALGSSS